TLSNGLTLPVATDHAKIEGTTFDNLAAGISVYGAAPYIGNCTVQNQNNSYDPGAHTIKIKYLLEPAGIYLCRDTARIRGGTLNTGGYFGIFAVNSEAEVKDLSISGNTWGVAAREGGMSLDGMSISSCSGAGISNYDGWWYYGNLSLTIEGCDLRDNDIGIELKEGQYDGAGTPHNIFIGNSTIDQGTTGIDAYLTDGLFLGNDITGNGMIVNGKRVRFYGNTISGGTGLWLMGETLRFENNTFDRNDHGLHAYNCNPILVNNDFTRNQYGVYAEHRGQPKLKYNNFEGNVRYGVYNDDSSTLVNATDNWWNAANGPGGEGSGDGDAVSKYVSYEPWLTEESEHTGSYENIPPETPSLTIPNEASLFFAAKGRAHDSEGDIIRRVELRIENVSRGSGDHDSDEQDSGGCDQDEQGSGDYDQNERDSGDYDSGWFSSKGIWRDVNTWGGYAHIFDAMDLRGDYIVSARAFDGNDYGKSVERKITIKHPKLERHSPIVIDGNGDFTPANGVRGGTGTEGDPYIIERWNISSNDSDAISISNTDSYVIVGQCNLHGNGDHHGIALSDAKNVKIEDSRFYENKNQIDLSKGSRAEVTTSNFICSDGDGVYSTSSFVNVSDSMFQVSRYALSIAYGPEDYMNLRDLLILGGNIFLNS
ncbi:MAG: right-handed parallel beta-helix repeat-containing protein, partial [Thermoplasmata archaeon]|nr:right-handed parallel beta-helix repeat-containing protein [Thermoplasmata archaeon]